MRFSIGRLHVHLDVFLTEKLYEDTPEAYESFLREQEVSEEYITEMMQRWYVVKGKSSK